MKPVLFTLAAVIALLFATSYCAGYALFHRDKPTAKRAQIEAVVDSLFGPETSRDARELKYEFTQPGIDTSSKLFVSFRTELSDIEAGLQDIGIRGIALKPGESPQDSLEYYELRGTEFESFSGEKNLSLTHGGMIDLTTIAIDTATSPSLRVFAKIWSPQYDPVLKSKSGK